MECSCIYSRYQDEDVYRYCKQTWNVAVFTHVIKMKMFTEYRYCKQTWNEAVFTHVIKMKMFTDIVNRHGM